MRYTEKKFSVGSPGTKEYADRWEQTFGPRRPDRDETAPADPENTPQTPGSEPDSRDRDE